MKEGGLHVLLTYLPKNSRVERQIVGRTGRKGLPGSFRQILCNEHLLEQFGCNIDFSSENVIKRRRDLIEAARVENLKLTLKDILFKEKLFSLFCNQLKKFETSFKPTLLEKALNDKKDELSKNNISRLLVELKESRRILDLDPCKQALKEQWAIWFSEQNINSLSDEEEAKMEKGLIEMMEREGGNLLKGICNNFYHLISGAITRSITFDEADSNFVLSTWDSVDSAMTYQDKRSFGSSIYYQRFILLKLLFLENNLFVE